MSVTIDLPRPVAPVPNLEPADPAQVILEEAAVMIEKNGWCQHTAIDNAGHICALQAIQMARNELSLSITDHYAAIEKIGVMLGGSPGHEQDNATRVYTWNDEEGRTADEVCRKLREAAAS